ncbi:MAG TPA: hypothetical protein VG797_00140 [Phycisphaerales bacterium]|nr:hypothetical protein [Phycisphaerales bacterium]
MTSGRASDDSPHASPSVWLPRLAHALDRLETEYRQLALMGEAQSAMISAVDGDGLLSQLAKRQVIVDRIEAINREIEPFCRRWNELGAAVPESSRAPLRARFEEIGRLVASISQRDDEDRRRLEKMRGEIATEVGSVQRGRGALNAYAPKAEPTRPLFQDQHG